MSAPIRHCETCQHFEHRPHMARPFCHKGQKLRFTFPKRPGLDAPETWGWRTRCKLYLKAFPPTPARAHQA